MFGLANRLNTLLLLLVNPRARSLRQRDIDYHVFLRYNLRWLKALGIDLIVDVGASRGEFSAIMHEVLPEARIVAFEPLPECFEQMVQRLRHVPNLSAHNIAIGDSVGHLRFYRSGHAPSSSLLPMTTAHKKAFPYSADHTMLSVPSTPLDAALAAEPPAKRLLVKMDVQGYEDRVIDGALTTLERTFVLWIETSFVELYEGQSLFAAIYDRLRSLGFEYWGAHEQLVSPLNDRVLQADSLFVRSEVTVPRQDEPPVVSRHGATASASQNISSK